MVNTLEDAARDLEGNRLQAVGVTDRKRHPNGGAVGVSPTAAIAAAPTVAFCPGAGGALVGRGVGLFTATGSTVGTGDSVGGAWDWSRSGCLPVQGVEVGHGVSVTVGVARGVSSGNGVSVGVGPIVGTSVRKTTAGGVGRTRTSRRRPEPPGSQTRHSARADQAADQQTHQGSRGDDPRRGKIQYRSSALHVCLRLRLATRTPSPRMR